MWLAILLWIATAAATSVAWAVRTGRLQETTARAGFTQLTSTFVLGAVVATALAILFQAMQVALEKRKKQATRSLGQLQVVATAIVLILVVMALVGDMSSALVSVGLVGFGLTLALQRPLLALAGWATIFFGGMFREGDRIQVGDVEGDVLAITLFTTRLWEIGSDRTPGRPTGRIKTVSNAVFLESSVANATSDTAIVFDEFVVNVAFESNQELAQQLLRDAGAEVLDVGDHKRLAQTYRKLTHGLAMEKHFPDAPFLLAESKPSWMEYRLRYLVDARLASRTQSELTQAWNNLTAQHANAIQSIYPRSQNMRIDAHGHAVDVAPN